MIVSSTQDGTLWVIPNEPMLRRLRWHAAGIRAPAQLTLDELTTREYTLEEVNEGYADMHAGVIRC
jgi:Zn-dependent alcohol dehydrogenase